MIHNINGTFISEKLNKTRWRPSKYNNSNMFITGSWGNVENFIRLWGIHENETNLDSSPLLIHSHPFLGDITEIKFIDNNNLVASSSEGSVYLFSISSSDIDSLRIVQEKKWNQIHKFKNGEVSSCTSLVTNSNDIVTIGEDGTINLLSAQHESVHKIEDAESCSLVCASFIRHNEILTGNSRGQMKIWDLRNNNTKAAMSFVLSGDEIAATCITNHPTQQHMTLAGDEEGSITVWDLRRNTYPVNLLNAHSESVSELHFHEDFSNVVCSASSAGELWLWKTNQSKQSNPLLSLETDYNPWYSGDVAKSKLEIFWLMPRLYTSINSLGINKDKVICGCDNEALYIISNINVIN